MRNAKDLDKISRISISLPTSLLEELDQVSRDRGFDSRSQAISEMLQTQLIQDRQRFGNDEMIGTITLVYDHSKNQCGLQLVSIQKKYSSEIVSSCINHINSQYTMEVIIIKGNAKKLKRISDELITCKGIKSGHFNLATSLQQSAEKPINQYPYTQNPFLQRLSGS